MKTNRPTEENIRKNKLHSIDKIISKNISFYEQK